MTLKGDAKGIPVHVSLISGSVAGVSEMACMYPLDVVKTRMQLSSGKIGLFSTFADMIKSERIGRLYRGIAFPLIAEVPKRAIKFTANETLKPVYFNQGIRNEKLLSVLTGVSAGFTEAVIVTVPELLKVRLQDKRNAALYTGTFDCLIKISRREGVFALYRGLEPTLWRHGAWNGTYFGCINYVRSVVPSGESKLENSFANFFTGILAGTLGTVLNTPFDVVKSRIQGQLSAPHKYNWTLPSVVTIAREEGFKALYKGFIPKVARLGPGGGILLLVYDYVASFLVATNI